MNNEGVKNGRDIFEVSENHWVIPEHLGKLECVSNDEFVFLCNSTGYGLSGIVKNSGFRVMVDTFDYFGDFHTSQGSIINIKTVDSKYRIRVTLRSLMRCIQLNGINQDGTLNGTYCFIPSSSSLCSGSDYFEIIPKFTKEYEIKYDISKIYNDVSIPFSKKMIPGHVYITKGKKLYLCLGSDLSLNCNDKHGGKFYTHYRSISKKVKLLYSIENIYSNTFLFLKTNKSYQESILDGDFAGPVDFFPYHVEIVWEGCAGKDLGLFFKDDGRPFREYTKNLSLGFPIIVLDESFRVNESFKKYNKSLGKEQKEAYVKINPDLRDIFTV